MKQPNWINDANEWLTSLESAKKADHKAFFNGELNDEAKGGRQACEEIIRRLHAVIMN